MLTRLIQMTALSAAFVLAGIPTTALSSEDGLSFIQQRLLRRPATIPGEDNASRATSRQALIATPANAPFPPMKVNFMALVNYTNEGRAKAARVKEILETVLNSEELRQAILNFEYEGKKQFVQNNGQTNEQIYETIRKGIELAYAGKENTFDIENEIYWPRRMKRWSVVGYTYPDSSRIWSNGNYFYYSLTRTDLAAHFMHEWLHKIGYDHDGNSTARRPYSVPYAIGELVGEIAEKMFPGDAEAI